ncbi:hypothetical protein E6H27_03615 [Candidatus Bathyarchaeota archaeon]|nr:MAG: hypothetical protein E6H27_03615 [Candidatus Bathyarchaeota archaeon]TMI57454.1 MAG: hypothetical protein E6H14_07220 [Candidatus Bathyarchaeota archaeon]
MLLLLFGSFSLVYSSVAYYSLSRPPSQEFIAWGIFSPSGSLSNYFSGAGANVSVGQTLDWHFAITNQMGSIQYVKVIYRLANSTSPNPNATVPASIVPQLGNSSVFIPNGRMAFVNFTWSVTSKSSQGGMIFINMRINGQQVSPPVGAVGGQRFRFFFELWTFDIASSSFQYGYRGQSSRVGVPLQVWFNSA